MLCSRELGITPWFRGWNTCPESHLCKTWASYSQLYGIQRYVDRDTLANSKYGKVQRSAIVTLSFACWMSKIYVFMHRTLDAIATSYIRKSGPSEFSQNFAPKNSLENARAYWQLLRDIVARKLHACVFLGRKKLFQLSVRFSSQRREVRISTCLLLVICCVFMNSISKFHCMFCLSLLLYGGDDD